MNGIPAAKRALRERFREQRLAIDDETYAAASRAICRRIIELPELADAETISVYWPILLKREVDTRDLIRELGAGNRRVVLPVVVDTESAPELGHVAFTGEESLRANRWGILEPAGEPVPPDEIQAVVAPALGAGRNLHRIGYGGGYYDAFLKHCPAPAVAAVFDVCLVDSVPSEPHDVPLAAIVTERETIRDSQLTARNTPAGAS